MIKKGILWIFVLFLSIQIFSFSSANGEKSNNTSRKVAAVVVDVVKKSCDVPEKEEKALFDTCHFIVRKTAHFTEYMVLAAAVFALVRSYRTRLRTALLLAGGYCLVYAAADEFHQLFVSGRSGQVSDVLIDFSGALVGLAAAFAYVKLYGIFQRKRSQKRSF